MIKEAKEKVGLGAESSSRTSSTEREQRQRHHQQQQPLPQQKLPEPLEIPKQSDSSDYDQRQTVLSRPLSPPKKSGGGFGILFR